MYRLTIPSWTNAKTGEHYPERTCYAMLVDCLLANTPQPPELIRKYYGDSPPEGALKSCVNDRLVFWNVSYGYIIIPNTLKNTRLWSRPDNLS